MGSLPLNLLTFPLWWYTTGTTLVWQWCHRQISFGLHKTGLLLFARHMGEPLFGDYTRTGIILGFALRVVLLLFKLVAFILRCIIIVLLGLGYLLLLPAILVIIIYQLFPA